MAISFIITRLLVRVSLVEQTTTTITTILITLSNKHTNLLRVDAVRITSKNGKYWREE